MNNTSDSSYQISRRQSNIGLKTVRNKKSSAKSTLNSNRSSTKSKKKTQSKQKYILNNLEFKKKDLLGEGTFSEVYKFRYKNKVDNKYVVKKIKVEFLRPYYSKTRSLANQEILDSFIDEINAIIELSVLGITPKIYGQFIDVENDKLYYVLQKLDYTFGHIIRNNKFNIEFTPKIIELLTSLMKTKYRHTDLHIDNMMYSESEKRFYLIDFGKQHVLKSKNSNNVYYTIMSNKDYALFDFTKKLSRSIEGSSGYSVIAILYLLLQSNKSSKAREYLNKVKLFIKKFVPKSKYAKVIKKLEEQDISKLI